ncbi:MAG: PEP-CTERM sorting domain-containing protein [Verrucomicrobiota bacterium]
MQPSSSILTSRIVSFVYGCCLVLSAPAAETIGPWTVTATPGSATLISGGGGSFQWLNVVNTPVTLNDAFTGFSVVDDGFANADSGTVLEFGFGPGVAVNGPGADLVIFDARYDAGDYALSTSLDNFIQELVYPAAVFAFTGESRSYYYNSGGPYSAQIWAAGVDLSDLGVADGASVSGVRLRTVNSSGDPIGLAVVPEPGTLGLIAAGLFGLLCRRRQT